MIDRDLLRPRVLRDGSITSTATQVLGQALAHPVLVAAMAAPERSLTCEAS
jgi:isopentenyl diphosphate isomerase/L-lactate dehydrogenase-like FMN-dependent dehydrogenase